MLFKPHFNEIIKNDNKSDLKRPMELTAEELNWIFLVKYSLCSINMDLLKPIWLCWTGIIVWQKSAIKSFIWHLRLVGILPLDIGVLLSDMGMVLNEILVVI